MAYRELSGITFREKDPTIKGTVYYDYQRSGADDMQYKIKVVLNSLLYSTSTYGFTIKLYVTLDSVKKVDGQLIKGNGSYASKGYTVETGWLTVPKKYSGTTSMSLELYSPNDDDGPISSTISKSLAVTDYVSTLKVDTMTIGQESAMSIDRKSSTFTHTISYEFGNATGTIATKTTSITPKWTPPASLLEQIPAGRTSISGTITLYTYSGSTLAGSHSYSVTLKAPALSTLTVPALALGKESLLTVSKKSDSYTHDITYTFGLESGTIVSKSLDTSVPWTPPTDLIDQIPVGKTSGNGRLKITTYNGTTNLGSNEYAFTLTAPSASSMSIPSLTIGKSAEFVIEADAEGLTHSISYRFGGAIGRIAERTEDLSVSWTPPASLLEQIPTSEYKVAGTITLVTYIGETVVGSKEYGAYVYMVMGEQPSCSFTVSDATGMQAAIGAYVQNRSRLSIAVNGTQADEYTEIERYEAVVDGAAFSSDTPTIDAGILTGYGTKPVVVYVVDARGRRSDPVSVYIEVLPYSKPSVVAHSTLSKIVVTRCTETGEISAKGTSLRVRCGRRYAPLTVDGESQNRCELRLRYKNEDYHDYGNWITLLSADAAGSDYDSVVGGITLNPLKGYNIQIEVEDSLGEKHTVDYIISTETITLHLAEGGMAVGIGRYASSDAAGRLDVAWESHFEQDVYMEAVDAKTVGAETVSAQDMSAANMSADTADLGTCSADSVEAESVDASSVSADSLTAESASIAALTVGGKTLLDLLHPVGSYYISANAASPATLFGGRWEQIKDMFLLAAGETYRAGDTGGEATHTLTVDEMPSHSHRTGIYTDYSTLPPARESTATGYRTVAYGTESTVRTGSTGDSQAHNNMPPYIVAYVWRRTQ